MPARTVSANPARTRPTGPKVASQSQPASTPPKRENPQAPKSQPVQNRAPIQNRVRVLLVHIPRLSIQGQARLAAEAGVSRSTISRLVNGRINPSYRLARSVTDVLERLLGEPLDMREVFSTDGTYLTASGCALCRCGGCLPEEAWGEDGTLKQEWRDARPGGWSLYPQMPIAQMSNAQMPNAQMPNAQMPNAQMPNAQMPNAQMPNPKPPVPPSTSPQPTGQLP